MPTSLSASLKAIADDPRLATFPLHPREQVWLEPLAADDGARLEAFYEGLSPRTRAFYSVTDPLVGFEHCRAIARHDKLRLVARTVERSIIALVEFSFDLTTADVARYRGYGFDLDPTATCRWGLCVADSHRGTGLAHQLAQASFEAASHFGRSVVILWGGVNVDNARAYRFYRHIGFTEVGRFTNDSGQRCIDMRL